MKMRGNGQQPVFLFLIKRVDQLKIARKKEKLADSQQAKPQRLKSEDVVSRVSEIAVPLCDSDGLELVYIEYQREPQGITLRIYIDKPGGISLQDCSHVTRQLRDLLDIHLNVPDNYRLEVSSPGLNRPLGKLSDFDRFKGQKAKIKIRQPIDGQKKFTGILAGVVQETVAIELSDRIVEIPYQDITRARLII